MIYIFTLEVEKVFSHLTQIFLNMNVTMIYCVVLFHNISVFYKSKMGLLGLGQI